ncbi:hypothetical protein FTO74_06620 [Granulicella sp. WH15]|uniref:hypothetical protein n=1 Tax=Granulicella sp. WH15 TaxID=2602070 RepID=UPI001366DFC4|nr:hypothetical protein [Granulicella sp. WH15]QHN03079.1 hypothetical protein FTO74_06620 [Granulicella sp. WH15]
MITDIFTKGIFTVLWSFYKNAVESRLKEIVLSQEILLAVVIGGVFSFAGSSYFPESAKIVDVSLGYLAYAAIALGFCVGGVTIALTLPDRDFVVMLATLTIPNKKGDALSGLFFVFCWTAIVHWLSVILILAVLVTSGHADGNLFATRTLHGRIILGTCITLCLYALMQFLITVLTLWQVGSVYIRNLQKGAASKQNSSVVSPNH